MIRTAQKAPKAWRVRPYEGDKWLVTTEPPTEEQRRYMEFVPLYETGEPK